MEPNDLAASLYAELVERSPRASTGEIEALCALHPELAAELRDLHATGGLLDDLARDAASSTPSSRASGVIDAGIPEIAGFSILRRVGHGGMGEVWEAFDLTLGRRVALKLLAPFASQSARDSERFRREALAAARLGHPNVVALFSTGEHAGRPYLVHELVEGGRTVRDEIEELRRFGAVPDGYERTVAQRFATLADALALAHSEGIVHRDVKPQNILLEPDGTPKLADFGLAKTVGEASLSHTGEFVGTWLYASPEQVSAESSAIGPSSDVFALGATLYECLTLERPFGGDDLQAIAREILHEDPLDPRAWRPRIDADLAVICLHALEKRPAARYASMGALRDDLHRYLAGEPIRARPPSAARRLQRAVLRHPTVSTAVLLSAAAFAAILFSLGRTERARSDLEVANERLRASNAALEAARAEAQTEAHTSAEVVTFLATLFRAGDPLDYGAGPPNIKEVILDGATRLRSGEVRDSRVRVRLLDELGVLLGRLGHWNEAVSMLGEAADLWDELGLGDSLEGVQTDASLALLHWDQGRVGECRALIEPLFARARLPNDLPVVARFEILGAMGFVQTETGDPAGGEALLREALELAPSLPPVEQFRVTIARTSLVAALLRQGRNAEATELVEPLCVELAALLPAGNAVALDAFNLRGKLRLERGELEGSLSDFETALVAAETHLGPWHPRSMNLQNNLATCYIVMRRWTEAEELLRHAIGISTEILGAGSPETLTALSNLGSVLIGSGRYAEAEEVLRSALEQELALHADNRMRTAQARSNLAICLYYLGRAGEAAELQAIALESASPDMADYANMQQSLMLYRSVAEAR